MKADTWPEKKLARHYGVTQDGGHARDTRLELGWLLTTGKMITFEALRDEAVRRYWQVRSGTRGAA